MPNGTPVEGEKGIFRHMLNLKNKLFKFAKQYNGTISYIIEQVKQLNNVFYIVFIDCQNSYRYYYNYYRKVPYFKNDSRV